MRRFPLCLGLLAALLLFFVLPLSGVAAPDEPGADVPAPPSDEERAEVRQMVEELRSEAARIRGLEWKRPVEADLLTRPQVRANMLEMVMSETTPEEREREMRIMRRMGLLGPDEDPLEMMLGMMEQMAGGYYNPDTERLYLVQGMVGDAQRPVILHELIHALEDQYLDLRVRMEKYENDSDRFFAEKCLGEGSAEHASMLYQNENPEIRAAYMKAQQDPAMGMAQMRVLSKIPGFLVLGTLLHYQLGPSLVGRSVGDDYPGGIAALYEDPPVSQEQFLHPAKWFAEEQDFPQQVAWGGSFLELAGDGWEEVHDGSAGELDLALYLDFFLGTTNGRLNLALMAQSKIGVPRATNAAAGWDGGRTYLMAKEGLPAVWLQTYVFDTPKDATEATDALLAALEKANGDSFALAEAVAEPGAGTRRFEYTGKHGAGRLLQRGTALFLADGVPTDLLEPLWKALAATTFERDPRDTWDPGTVVDPYETCDWADREAGIGVVLPDEDWVVDGASGMPGMVATLDRGDLQGLLIMIPAPMAMAKGLIEAQLAQSVPGLDVSTAQAVQVAGSGGWRYAAGNLVLFMGGGSKTVVLRFQGSAEALEAAADEIALIAKYLVIGEE